MEKQFVTYEIALKLKELDFDEECLACFHTFLTTDNKLPLLRNFIINKNSAIKNHVSAPLWQQAIDWFREKYYIHIEIRNYKEYQKDNYAYALNFTKNSRYSEKETKIGMIVSKVYHDNYEQARKQAILKAIELCKTN